MILGVIPARGGSKGVLRKNIRLIAGKPLIAWTIEAARHSTLLDDFIVSTENTEIANIAREYGAKVIDRPPHLATDEASTLSVLQHLLQFFKVEAFVLLQPTSPIRDEGLIDLCIKKFKETGADNLATGYICKIMEYGTYDKRRQELSGYFYDDGNVYVMKPDLIRQGKMCGDNVQRVLTDRENNVEIDDEYDLWLAEQVLLKRSKENRDKSV